MTDRMPYEEAKLLAESGALVSFEVDRVTGEAINVKWLRDRRRILEPEIVPMVDGSIAVVLK